MSFEISPDVSNFHCLWILVSVFPIHVFCIIWGRCTTRWTAMQTKRKKNLSKQKHNVHVLNNKRCIVFEMIEEFLFSTTQSLYQYAVYKRSKQQWYSELLTVYLMSVSSCLLSRTFCSSKSYVSLTITWHLNTWLYT